MQGRRVLVEIVRGSDGSLRGGEGLRAVIGLRRAPIPHDVRLVVRDGGVDWVKRVSPSDAPEDLKALLTHLRVLDIPRVVEKESLEDRGLTADDIVEGLEIVERSEIEALRKEVEARIVY